MNHAAETEEDLSMIDEATLSDEEKTVIKQVSDFKSVPPQYTGAVEKHHQNTAIRQTHHTNVTGEVIQFWREEKTRNEAMSHLDYQCDVHMPTTHPWRLNNINNIVRLPPDEKVLFQKVDLIQKKGGQWRDRKRSSQCGR